MNYSIKKGDAVKVISGKDKGKSGQVIAVLKDQHRVVVEGVNIVSKHTKPRNAQQKGGIVKREGSIDVSNVMLVCASCGKPTRVGHKIENNDGKENKVRVCVKCGSVIAENKAKTAGPSTVRHTAAHTMPAASLPDISQSRAGRYTQAASSAARKKTAFIYFIFTVPLLFYPPVLHRQTYYSTNDGKNLSH